VRMEARNQKNRRNNLTRMSQKSGKGFVTSCLSCHLISFLLMIMHVFLERKKNKLKRVSLSFRFEKILFVQERIEEKDQFIVLLKVSYSDRDNIGIVHHFRCEI